MDAGQETVHSEIELKLLAAYHELELYQKRQELQRKMTGE